MAVRASCKFCRCPEVELKARLASREVDLAAGASTVQADPEITSVGGDGQFVRLAANMNGYSKGAGGRIYRDDGVT
jgi:hypothetical protein